MSRRRGSEVEDIDNIISLGHKNEPAEDFGKHVVVHQETHDRVRMVFSDFPDLMANEAVIAQVANLTVTIRDEAQTSIEAYLKIGFALIDLEDVLDKRDDVIDAYFKGRLVPFSKAHASKITTVSRDFRSGRYNKAAGRDLTARDLPAIGAAYEIRCLTDEEMKLAAARGLIDPLTSQSAVKSFRDEIKSIAISDGAMNQIKLQKELGKLTQKKTRLENEIDMLNIRIEAIREQLKAQQQQKFLHAAE